MTALPTEKVTYALPVLRDVFTKALNDKTCKTAGYPDWAKAWPQGNTIREQLLVDWLGAQADSGYTRIETAFPLADFTPMGSYEHTLSRQIECGLAKGIV